MSEQIRKVTEEEFDGEGNLVKRTVTEYTGFATGGVIPATTDRIRVGDTWPYAGGTYTVTDPHKYQSYNGIGGE